MTVTVTIHTDNAAFDGQDWGQELARILLLESRRFAAGSVPLAAHTRPLRDINGNTVGCTEIIE